VEIAVTTPAQETASGADFTLVVGPVTYYWTRATLTEFYAEVADSAAQTVYLGETVCSRRREMKAEDWFDLARDLSAVGKDVVLSAQVLVESESDLRLLRRLAENGEFQVEANDAAAVRLLAGRGPFVLGPHINIYSRDALREYAELGPSRWVAPLELSIDAVAAINPAANPMTGGASSAPIETEIFAFGRMPLAFSARCFTARHYHLQKDDCAFRCIEHPDGLLLSSRDGEPFLAMNGIQTQSAGSHCLIGEREALSRAGIRRLRLSPQSQNFAAIVRCFDGVFNRGESATEAAAMLDQFCLPGGLVNGYAAGVSGKDWSPVAATGNGRVAS
jgi:collagenase-like PrtC family protease